MDVLLQEIVKYLPAGQAISIGLLVWILYKVTRTNGSVIELKTWREFHEQMLKERFIQVYRKIEDVERVRHEDLERD
jgi:hypothetical protein